MNPVAFTVKVPVAHLAWSSDTGRGGMVPGAGSEVVMQPEATVALIVELGADGFAFLSTLALLARPDDQGRLYVDGGIERLRTVLGWGDEKATKVFRRVRDAGFVTREQAKDPSAGSRFGASRLILDPSLYAPDVTAGGAASGGPGTGAGAPGVDAGRAASGGSGSGAAASGVPAPRTSGSGEPGSGPIGAGQAASGFPGSGEPDPMNDLSDEEMVHHDGTPATGGDLRRRASVVAALELLAFTDAAAFADVHPLEVIERSLRHVVDRVTSLDNPGGYLRRMVEQGGPPPTGAELAGRIAALIAPTAPPPGPAPASPSGGVPGVADDGPGPSAGSELWGDGPPSGLPDWSAEEVAARLERLEPEVRARFEADADAVADAAVRRARAQGLRLPRMVVGAERHLRLVALLVEHDPPA